MTRKKRKFRIFIKTIFAILFWPAVFYILFNSSFIQSILVKQATNYLSKQLKTEVSIEKVDIAFFNSVLLKDIFVKDLQKDTLLHIQELEAELYNVFLDVEKIFLSKLILKNLTFNLKIDSLNISNLQFILDAFASDKKEKDTVNQSNWKIICFDFELINTNFRYQKHDTIQHTYGLNFNDLYLYNLNLDIQGLTFSKDSILFDIENFSFKEKSGFALNELSAYKNVVNSKTINLNDFKFVTAQTKFFSKEFRFVYNSYEAFNDFINEIDLSVKIDKSTEIGLKDISYFVPDIKGYNQILNVSGNIFGKISRLFIDSLDIKYAKKTKLRSHISISGLPNIEKTFLFIKIDTLSTTRADLATIKSPKDSTKQLIVIPQQLSNVGRISYIGEISGYINKIKAKGDIISNIGNINTKITIDRTKTKNTNINGKIDAVNLNLGKLLDNEENFGNITFKNTINININKSIEVETNTKIDSVMLYRYNYKDITLDGNFTQNKFFGNIVINDENLQTNFIGGFDFSYDVPLYEFSVFVNKIVPYKLNLYNDSSFTASIILKTNFVGNKINNIDGNVYLILNEITNSKGQISNENIIIEAIPNYFDSTSIITINSQFADIELNGKIDITDIAKSFKRLVYKFVPTLKEIEDYNTKDSIITIEIDSTKINNFEYKFNIKDTKILSEMFMPEVKIAKNSLISGNYNSLEDSLKLTANIAQILFYNNYFNNLNINLITENDSLKLNIDAKEYTYNDNVGINNIKIFTAINSNYTNTNIIWENNDSLYSSADINLSAYLSRNEETNKPIIKARIKPSELNLDNNIWALYSRQIIIDSTYIRLKNITCINNNQLININGAISEKDNDTLFLKIIDFDLQNFNPLTKPSGLSFSGLVNGETKLYNLYKNALFKTNDSITDMKLNNIYIGNLYLKSNVLENSSKIFLDARMQNRKIKSINFSGYYSPKSKDLDFTGNINKFKFKLIKPFVKGILSRPSGIVYGDISLKGTTDKPQLSAKLKFARTIFTVDYLQTRYNFSDSIFITSNKVEFNKIRLNESMSSYAYLSGNISHNMFNNLNFDINLDAHNFLMLNTKVSDTTSFYGKAYLTGNIQVGGTPEDVEVNVSVKTDKYTQFFIPLSSNSTISDNNSFIKFESKDTTAKFKIKEKEISISGVKLNFDIDVNTDAEIQLIMDEKVGDIIKARGIGNLNLQINTLGKFNMFGKLTLYSGDYLFTLKNLLNKKFSIEKGGNITWTGNPFNALINLNAIYKIKKVPLYDLTLDDNSKDKKIAVNCNLYLKNKLMNPKISFGLDLSGAEDKTEELLKNLPEDNLNKQILSLLVLKKFQALPGITSEISESNSTNLVGSNTTEMLSNQLSHWLSQISDNFDIGVNYQLGDEMTTNELEVALSTQLFNDRVSINSNVGVGGGKIDNDNPSSKNNSEDKSNNIVGDVEIEVKLNKSGSVRLKGFTRANEYSSETYKESQYKQGVGISFRKDFNTFGDLFKDIWNNITFKKYREKRNKKKNKKNNNKDIERKE